MCVYVCVCVSERERERERERDLFFYVMGRKQAEGVWKQGPEVDICYPMP
jgi:hypothetical protein